MLENVQVNAKHSFLLTLKQSYDIFRMVIIMNGFNKNIQEQLKIFEKIIKKNKKLMEVLKVLEEYSKTNPRFKDYYVGAGSVNQTVFNYLSGNEIDYGIKDFDIVYYDEDLSYEHKG